MGSALVIQQGDDRPLVWNLSDADNQPITDLTGYTARAQVRARADSIDVLHEWSTVAGNAVLAESSLVLKVDDSESWTWRRGVYDVQITDPSGASEIVDRGAVVVTPVVTH